MSNQNYTNHRRIFFSYHIITFGVLLIAFIGAIVNFSKSIGGEGLYSSSLLLVTLTVSISLFFHSRIMALKAQDRAIRAEESFRYFVLTGKPLPKELTIYQIIALRFASDDELTALAQRSAAENMKPDDIKKAIINWRADEHRV